MSEYAVVIDETYDAVLLRDVCQREADKYAGRAASSRAAHAVTKNNTRRDIFRKYEERFEHIRLQEVQRIVEALTG